MERRKFIKSCCYSTIGIPLVASSFQSCGFIYYASTSRNSNRVTVAKSEFLKVKKNKTINRDFVLVELSESEFPICLYKIEKDKYVASLLKCTHKGCELNIGGGFYSCPCHGSEFSTAGEVLEGPAINNLLTFKTDSDNENIYIHMS